jgi:hypothetical protein
MEGGLLLSGGGGVLAWEAWMSCVAVSAHGGVGPHMRLSRNVIRQLGLSGLWKQAVISHGEMRQAKSL